VSLAALRTAEQETRIRLGALRADLAEAVDAIAAGERAAHELVAHVAKGAEGVYRGAAEQRAGEWRDQVAAGRAARERLPAMRREEADLLGALEQIRLDIERAGVKRELVPVLASIPRAYDCDLRWDEARGDGDARVCPRCEQRVFNVAMLEPEGAEKLLATAPAGCRFHRRSDGTILAGQCPGVSLDERFAQRSVAIAASLLLVGAAVGASYEILTARHVGSEPGGMIAPPPPHGDEWPQPVALLDASVALDVQRVVVDDSFATIGGQYDTKLTLDRRGDSFHFALACSSFTKRATRAGTIPARVVDAFTARAAVLLAQPTAAPVPCRHTDDYPRIRVRIEQATPDESIELSVENCSYQWHAGARPLPPDALTTAAYRALLAAAGERECFADAKEQPAPPGSCNPPYWIDARGDKIYRAECF